MEPSGETYSVINVSRKCRAQNCLFCDIFHYLEHFPSNVYEPIKENGIGILRQECFALQSNLFITDTKGTGISVRIIKGVRFREVGLKWILVS